MIRCGFRFAHRLSDNCPVPCARSPVPFHLMGIADRHYIRDRPQEGYAARGASVLRGWSANTWLILICVMVFVIDPFTAQFSVRNPNTGREVPVQWVPGRNYPLVEGTTPPARAKPKLDAQPVGRSSRGLLLVPLVDPASGQQVGYTEVYPLNGRLASWLHFSTERGFLNIEFWRLIGFQFLHANFGHLLFNMIGLFFFGPLVERYLGSKRYLAFYLLCGICGALLYALLNLGGIAASLMLGDDVNVPGLLFNDTYVPLIGASAGVFGVLMAGAFLAPSAIVLLFFIIPMRLWVVAYGLVLLALWTVVFGGNNAGGEAGHLGGAMAGWYFIRHPRHLHGFFDFLGWVDPTSHHYRDRKRIGSASPHSVTHQREIDRILEKISREGIQSLSDDEKRTLREASRQ